MITVRLFASLREQLQCAQRQLPADGIESVAALLSALEQDGGVQWRMVLDAPNVLCAVNREIADRDATVKDDDEVAFFPPVTGG